jgi:hypothetical protein
MINLQKMKEKNERQVEHSRDPRAGPFACSRSNGSAESGFVVGPAHISILSERKDATSTIGTFM